MFKKMLIGLAATAAAAVPAQAVVLYGVTETNQLVSFNSSAPGTFTSSVGISGVSGNVLGLDFRVRDGKIYALTDSLTLYTVDRLSGVASLVRNYSVPSPVASLSGGNFAFDFNPTNANLRIISNNDTNYFVNFGTPTRDLVQQANAAYASGGPANLDIAAAAYLNNDNNPGTGTTLFVIDSLNDRLGTMNVGTGIVTPVAGGGALGVNFGGRSSFDIFTNSAGANSAFATSGGTLYSVNLSTGAASAIGNTQETVFGLTAIGVPEPSTWMMMIFGFGLIGSQMRRRSRHQVASLV